MSEEKQKQETASTSVFPLQAGESSAPAAQSEVGIVCVGGTAPQKWLEDFAVQLDEQYTDEDATSPIPDVLAIEHETQWMLAHPAQGTAKRLAAWRGLLAALLLWDSWKKDSSWPVLTLEDFSETEDAFIRTVRGALTASRRAEGLRLFALHAPGAEEKHPLALVSRETIISPAADMGDLSGILPPAVRWYDPAQGGFFDPCEQLPATERARLAAQLRLLARLCPETEASSAIQRFLSDLREEHRQARHALEAEEPTALRQLECRIKAVYALRHEADFAGFACQEEELPAAALAENPLVRCFLTDDAALAEQAAPDTQRLWCWQGVPIAVEDGELLLAPTGHPREQEALRTLRENLYLLENCSPGFRARLAEALTALQQETEAQAALMPQVRTLIAGWRTEVLAPLDISEQELHLTWPAPRCVPALALLLREYLGLDSPEITANPFSPLLTLADRAPEDVLGEASRRCVLPATMEHPACVALPPLSAALCQLLNEQTGGCRLAADKLVFAREFHAPTETVEAAFTLYRTVQEGKAAQTRTVVLHRTYTDRQINHVPFEALPTVAAWPCTAVQSPWRAYYLYAQRTDALDVWGFTGEAWRQGRVQTRFDRSWQVLRTDRFPSYAALRRGALGCGALLNLNRPREPRSLGSAVLALDPGAAGTAAAMALNGEIKPLTLENMQRVLLRGPFAGRCNEEFLPSAPLNGVCFSAWEAFAENAAQEPLLDGHRYMPAGMESACAMDAEGLRYGFGAGCRTEKAQETRGLFLRQLMTEAVLAAHAAGATDVSWRIALPEATRAQRQSYFTQTQTLAAQVSEDTDIPLTADVPPVQWAEENDAISAYFLHNDQLQAQASFLTLDIGGSSASLGLCSGAEGEYTAHFAIPMGMHTMLDGLRTHPERLTEDFDRVLDHPQLVREVRVLTKELAQTRDAGKGRLLLDLFLGGQLYPLSRHMNQYYEQNRCTYTQACLLQGFAELLTLLGAFRDQLGASADLPVCLAGRGALWLQRLSPELKENLGAFLSAGSGASAPTLYMSAAPKQEIAQGLLRLTRLHHDIPQEADTTDAPTVSEAAFLARFREALPQAAQRLQTESTASPT